MAIAPTGDVYKSLTFDGKTSRSYGVYITGEAVYNAPEREVEMISIPGRNGAFALDKGRFENVTVTYPAGIFADNETDFAAAISDFRNYLCSRKGYCRLTDEYNPNEYRMAVYKSGLEVEPAMLKAGEFEITFDCKPQRWLTSGETKQTIANSGDTITNPTLFESGPLLEIEGYGTIGFNGYEIEIADELVGDVLIEGKTTSAIQWPTNFPEVYISSGDTIDVDASSLVALFYKGNSGTITGVFIDNWSGDTSTAPTVSYEGQKITVNAELDAGAFSYGTSSSLKVECTVLVWNYIGGGVTNNERFDVVFEIAYNGSKRVTWRRSGGKSSYSMQSGTMTMGEIVIHSTATTFGHPTYIDCDLGEAYANDNGVISSLNSYIELGSKLPTLAPGSNAITFDNTITDLKVTPRWWKV